ncbi:hypothetical protein [Mucilaginibacter sp.]|uniref:hypothetical protein n=1 Tax=Mucilaginibacter sp. TaxID=1882438 RepID=UPI002ED50381
MREKIYVHFDKHNYLSGDTVWFKAYLSDGTENSRYSKNFYLEVTTPNGELVRRFTSPILESTAYGNIILPLDSNIIGYFTRAYTISELNSDTAFIYENFLKIANSIQKAELKNQADPVIKFMPEGGNWLINVPCVMAFKVTNSEGLPENAAGFIKDDKNKVITTFESKHDGMGSFMIIPQEERRYFAVWKSPGGKEQYSLLPIVQEQGIALQVSRSPNGKRFTIFRSKTIIESNKKLTVLACLNSKIIYEAKVDLTLAESTHDVINTKGLPSGILNITIFDNELNPIAERITFINNENYGFAIQPSLLQTNKKRRGLNIIKLIRKDSVRSNVSVAITDSDLDPSEKYKSNIISQLLFTGDLRGKIFDPFYYFQNTADSTLADLDLVMLTHGWRKYNWQLLRKGEGATTFKETNFLTLDGKITGVSASSLKSSTTVNILLTTADSSATLFTLPITKEGTFFKDGIIFFGTGKLHFSVAGNRRDFKIPKIVVRNGLLDQYRLSGFDYEYDNHVSLSKSGAKLHLLDSIKRIRNFSVTPLKEVVIKAKPVENTAKLDRKFTSGLFQGGITQQVDISNDPTTKNYRSLFQYLQLKIPGIQVTNPTSLSPSVSWRNAQVKFFLNNVESSTTDLRSIDMTEFIYMKVYDPSQGGAFGANGGVIAVYTKIGKGTDYVKEKDNRLLNTLNGYSIVQEFYSPDYSTAVISDLSRDTRTTLYWNPNLIMDESSHEFDIHFFNNDFSRRFKVVIEGINAEGKLTYEEKVF